MVQKHRASHLHYDFRLEADGVLKSWAVPKGPTLDPQERRLAMQVEDHPYAYRDFEGVIPEGNYGAGEVIVWDRGTYDPVDVEDPATAIDRGRIKFVLHGKKLHGAFMLVKMRGRSENDNAWLLIKDRDEAAERGWSDRDHDESVKTGRTLEDVAKNPRAKRWISNRSAPPVAKAPAPKLPKYGAADLTLATLTDEPFQDPDWIFEIKWDGIRALCVVDGERRVRLVSRRGLDQLGKFPELVDLGAVFDPVPIVVDGEIVSLDAEGRSSFQRLQSAANRRGAPVTFVAFDLLYFDGKDVRREPLEKRKKLLERAIARRSDRIMYSKHVQGDGIALFTLAQDRELEGIIAKRKDAPYASGRRTRDWLKIKTHRRQECVIGGFTEPRGARHRLGALLLGLYEEGKLVYVGHVGTGFTNATLESLYAKLSRIETTRCPFSVRPKPHSPAHWVEPKYVAEVRFAEWTNDGKMRQPAFLGLRDDKTPEECVREEA